MDQETARVSRPFINLSLLLPGLLLLSGLGLLAAHQVAGSVNIDTVHSYPVAPGKPVWEILPGQILTSFSE